MQLITATGQAFPLKIGINTIGRGADNDIVLNDRSMSRQHAALHWDGAHCAVSDLGSTNGTFLGSQRLVPHQPQPVPPGVPLTFGPTMRATLTGGAEVAPTAHVPLAADAPAPVSGLDVMFRALDAALDRQKLGVAFLGLLSAGIVVAFFFWVSSRITLDNTVLSAAIALVGVILLWCAFTLVTATLSRMIFRELGEGQAESARRAVRYAGQHFLTYLLSPLTIVIGLVLVLVIESVFLLLGRVQYVGELAVSLAFLPLVIVNLSLILIVWFGTALIYPIISDRGGGIADTITCVLALIRRAPGRLVAYMMVAGITSLLMFVICFYLVLASVSTTTALASLGMEADRFALLVGGLPLGPGDLMPGLALGSLGGPWLPEPPITYTIARIVFGLSLLALVMFVLAIPQLFYLASACAVYLNVREQLPGMGTGGMPLGGTPPGAGNSEEKGQKACWLCGSALAHDQSYCPNCKQLQR